jgi:hypothetical protein
MAQNKGALALAAAGVLGLFLLSGGAKAEPKPPPRPTPQPTPKPINPVPPTPVPTPTPKPVQKVPGKQLDYYYQNSAGQSGAILAYSDQEAMDQARFTSNFDATPEAQVDFSVWQGTGPSGRHVGDGVTNVAS